ncbi:hypothetical protein V3429_02225 [Aeromonas jandaei]|uniref:hypothetical protein n=1 Tax=Aeromonas jandaei TaxID=650 RepID=UPI0030CE11EF
MSHKAPLVDLRKDNKTFMYFYHKDLNILIGLRKGQCAGSEFSYDFINVSNGYYMYASDTTRKAMSHLRRGGLGVIKYIGKFKPCSSELQEWIAQQQQLNKLKNKTNNNNNLITF